MGGGLIFLLGLAGLAGGAMLVGLAYPVRVVVDGRVAEGRWQQRIELVLPGGLRWAPRARKRGGRSTGSPRPEDGARARRTRASSERRPRLTEVLEAGREWAAEVPPAVGRLRRSVRLRSLEVRRVVTDDPAEAGWLLGALHGLRGMGVPLRIGTVEVRDAPPAGPAAWMLGHLAAEGDRPEARPGGEAGPLGSLEVEYAAEVQLWPGRVVGAAAALAVSRPARRHARRAVSRWWARRREALTRRKGGPIRHA